MLSDERSQSLNLGILRLVPILEKTLFNVSTTLSSSVTIMFFSLRTIFSEFSDLSEKQRLIVLQNFLLFVTFVNLGLHSIWFLFSNKGYTEVYLFIANKLISVIP